MEFQGGVRESMPESLKILGRIICAVYLPVRFSFGFRLDFVR
jgi:hypothetical protein